MAHYGKTFPVSFVNRVAYEIGPFTRSYPARCLRFRQTTAVPVGTAAVQWNGLTVISTPGEYDPIDSRYTTWTWQHPTNAALSIVIRLRYIEPTTAPTSTTRLCWNGDMKHVESGVTLARQDFASYDLIAFFQGGHATFTIAQIWTQVFFPAKQGQFIVECGAALWGDQPSYHPYRH